MLQTRNDHAWRYEMFVWFKDMLCMICTWVQILDRLQLKYVDQYLFSLQEVYFCFWVCDHHQPSHSRQAHSHLLYVVWSRISFVSFACCVYYVRTHTRCATKVRFFPLGMKIYGWRTRNLALTSYSSMSHFLLPTPIFCAWQASLYNSTHLVVSTFFTLNFWVKSFLKKVSVLESFGWIVLWIDGIFLV